MTAFKFEGRIYPSPFICQVAICTTWLEEAARAGRKVAGLDPFNARLAVDSMFEKVIEVHDYIDGDDEHRLMPLHPFRDTWDEAMTQAHLASSR